ncbi:ATP-binding cassette, subfamily B, MsbA [Chitinophaga costaii]|uniref:ATP-binding cassette, subfamily B, MsbA n=1 Tax=Chitinophaga costaii TaxID=1335309 RepID=A0A1C4DSH0_9BACT|nr:ABC transporter ATP-binding protein [Chitinophaga costaii]PUZ27770.1 ABC transporter ATP-binding protein [Chitinophaga costaii]SCC34273.1 ATP-binding cassette, subfamily B, MsbA [Chitinophaga costaii]
MKTFKRLLNFATPLRHYVPELMTYTFFGIIFGIVNFTMLIPMLQVIFGQQKMNVVNTLPHFTLSVEYFKTAFNYYFYQFYTPATPLRGLAFVCSIIVLSTILANFFRYMSARVLVRMRMNVLERMRNRLYDNLTHQSLDFFHNRQKGEILSVMTNDVQEIEASVISSIQVFLRDPFIIIAYFGVLFYMSWTLTLFTIVFFPISGFLISYISKRLKQKGYFSQEMLGKILNVSEETISGIRIIQSFSSEGFMQRKFAAINRKFSAVSKSMFNQREMASPISEMMGVIVIVILVMYGGQLVLSRDNAGLTGPSFIVYLVFYSQILNPAKNISSALTTLQRGIVAGERIFKLLDEPPHITERPNAIPVSHFNNRLVYENVTFKYEQQNVLHRVNLAIDKGHVIALVGKSGAGKSTMADLLPRFYDVNEGRITLDGQDIRDFKLNDLRNLMGMVSQEAILFNDTVFNNIAFGQTDAKLEDVIQAAKIANAHEFIEQLEHGYDTSIGDRGMKLSGGQRQRLTIARAVFKNPPIMILDEATSALDTESEKLVQEALDKLMQNRTTIVIAHRLSTIQYAHEIIVMDKGEIVERGRHDDLMALNGIYRRLVEMQEFK